MEKCPKKFYKYRSMDSAAEWVERIVCHNEIYFTKPLTFNDPFDCCPSFNFDASSKEKVAYFKRILKKHCPNLNRHQLHQEVLKKVRRFGVNPINTTTATGITEIHTKQIKENIGVFCLSLVHNDILMWSHYADSHRGICLEFDGNFEFFARAHEVKYPLSRPRINPFRQNNDEMLETALLSKSNQWAYEQEWRLIQYINGSGIYIFPAEALTGVILGAQISSLDRNKVIDWIGKREHPVKLYKANPCANTFSLNISEQKIRSVKT